MICSVLETLAAEARSLPEWIEQPEGPGDSASTTGTVSMQEETRSTGANKQVAGYIIPLAYATLLLATAWARRRGLNPGALRFDDVWVAVLTKSSSIFSLAAVPTSEPLGFVATLWIARRVISDPEVSLQVVPFLCGLAAIRWSAWPLPRSPTVEVWACWPRLSSR